MATRIPYPKLFQAMLNLHGFVSETSLCGLMIRYHPNASEEIGVNLLNRFVFEHADEFEFRKTENHGMFAFKKGALDISIDKFIKHFVEGHKLYLYVPENEDEFLKYSSSYDENPEAYVDDKVLNDFRIFLKYVIKKPADFKRFYEASLKYAPRMDTKGLKSEFGRFPIPDSKLEDYLRLYYGVLNHLRRPNYGGFTLDELSAIFGVETIMDCEPFEDAALSFGFYEHFRLS